MNLKLNLATYVYICNSNLIDNLFPQPPKRADQNGRRGTVDHFGTYSNFFFFSF